MSKEAFLAELEKALSGLPKEEVWERLAFYREMIDDRMEEGLTEEAAVAGVGPIDGIVTQTVAEVPLAKLVKERVKPRRTVRGWEIAPLVLGFPLWFSLLAAAGAVVLALYLTVWSLIVALWAIELALLICAVAGIAAAIVLYVRGAAPQAAALLAVGLVSAGLLIFLFYGCAAASRGILRLTAKALVGFKSMFLRKENSQ